MRTEDRLLNHRGYWIPARADFLAICEGRVQPAVLLSVLEYWSGVRLRRGDPDLWIYRTQPQLVVDSCGVLGGRKSVGSATTYLLRRGYIERRRNPLLGFDRVWQYSLIAEKIQAAIDDLGDEGLQTPTPTKNGEQPRRNERPEPLLRRPEGHARPTAQERSAESQSNVGRGPSGTSNTEEPTDHPAKKPKKTHTDEPTDDPPRRAPKTQYLPPYLQRERALEEALEELSKRRDQHS